MSRGIDGRLTEYKRALVTLDASGNGTLAIAFDEAFPDPPQMAIISRRGDAGSFTAASVTKLGFTLTVVASDVRSQDLYVTWFAHEKT